MSQKIRELKAILLKAGFTYRPGKSSHTVWSHLLLENSVSSEGETITISADIGFLGIKTLTNILLLF